MMKTVHNNFFIAFPIWNLPYFFELWEVIGVGIIKTITRDGIVPFIDILILGDFCGLEQTI